MQSVRTWLVISAFVAITAAAAFSIYDGARDARALTQDTDDGYMATTSAEHIVSDQGAAVLPGAADLPSQVTDRYPLKLVKTHGGGEWMPDLSPLATKEVLDDGRWSEIFPSGALDADDVVRIPEGVSVVYDVARPMPFTTLVIEGSFAFATGTSAILKVGTITVSHDGVFSMRPNPGVTSEVIFSGGLSTDKDPLQMTLGILATGGTIDIQGRAVATPFVEATGAQGESSLRTSSATSWRAGDEIYITSGNNLSVDAAHWTFNHRDESQRKPFPEQGETRRVTGVSGTTVTLDKPLAYDHSSGPVYAALLSRSAIFRSDPTNPDGARGHILLSGDTRVSVRYARLEGLGRTTTDLFDDTIVATDGTVSKTGKNQRGRYVLHAHHVMAPFVFEGNAVVGSPKWGIVNHDSNGIIRGNIVVGAAGAGIVGEDGPETGTVSNNLVIGTGGGTGQNDDDRFGSTAGRDMAAGGFGYWFRGPFLEVTDNIAAGHFNQAGFAYFVHPRFARELIPDNAGIPADLRGKSGKDLAARNPIRRFTGNEAYGYFGNAAMTIFYANVDYSISDFTAHLFGKGATSGIILRHSSGLTVADSSLKGTGIGKALVSSESGEIQAVRTELVDFSSER